MEATPKRTSWESVCKLAGRHNEMTLSIQEAVDDSAVNCAIANVEIAILVKEGVIKVGGGLKR